MYLTKKESRLAHLFIFKNVSYKLILQSNLTLTDYFRSIICMLLQIHNLLSSLVVRTNL